MSEAGVTATPLDLVGDFLGGLTALFAKKEVSSGGIEAEIVKFALSVAVPLREAASRDEFEASFRKIVKRNVMKEFEKLSRKPDYKEVLRQSKVKKLKPALEPKVERAADVLFDDIRVKLQDVKIAVRKAKVVKGARLPSKDKVEDAYNKAFASLVALAAASADEHPWTDDNLRSVWGEGIGAYRSLLYLYRVSSREVFDSLARFPVVFEASGARRELVDLGLDEVAMEKSWQSAMKLIEEGGEDAKAFVGQAADALSYWRERPAEIGDELVLVRDEE